MKNVNTKKRQLSSSESGDSNDNTEVQKPEQRQKKAGNKVQSEDRLRKMQKKSSRQLISTESEDSDSLLRRSKFQTQHHAGTFSRNQPASMSAVRTPINVQEVEVH